MIKRSSESLSERRQERLCAFCRKPIPAARLEALPDIDTCVACATKRPRKLDTSFVELSEASPINRNGFAPKD
jgi:RNA polymerase-binding transcription factor DksA